MSDEETRVCGLSCTPHPREEVFSVNKHRRRALRQLNERAGIPVSRIDEAIAVTSDQAD